MTVAHGATEVLSRVTVSFWVPLGVATPGSRTVVGFSSRVVFSPSLTPHTPPHLTPFRYLLGRRCLAYQERRLVVTSLAVLVLRVWNLGRIHDDTQVMIVPGFNLALDDPDLDPPELCPLWLTMQLVPRARLLNVESTLIFPGESRFASSSRSSTAYTSLS